METRLPDWNLQNTRLPCPCASHPAVMIVLELQDDMRLYHDRRRATAPARNHRIRNKTRCSDSVPHAPSCPPLFGSRTASSIFRTCPRGSADLSGRCTRRGRSSCRARRDPRTCGRTCRFP